MHNVVFGISCTLIGATLATEVSWVPKRFMHRLLTLMVVILGSRATCLNLLQTRKGCLPILEILQVSSSKNPVSTKISCAAVVYTNSLVTCITASSKHLLLNSTYGVSTHFAIRTDSVVRLLIDYRIEFYGLYDKSM